MTRNFTVTKATNQLSSLVRIYSKVLPINTFPWVPLTIAAFAQVFAWTSGSTLLSNYSLVPRVLLLWIFAACEYLFMSPAMNAGVEVLGMSEALLVVIYQVVTLVVFLVVNTVIYRHQFKIKYLIAFTFLAAAVYTAHL